MDAPAPDLQPILEGTRLRARPLRPDDWDALLAAAADPLIWAQHPEPDRWKPEVFRRYFDGGLASGGALLVTDRADGRVIGSSRYFGWEPATREIEIGWTFLVRSHWGGAYNRELKRLMLAHAFTFAERVVFLVGPENRRSQVAVERIGAVREGIRHRFGIDNVCFVLTPAAFRDGLGNPDTDTQG